MKREDYIKEAYSIMQDVEEVADLLEDREIAEQKYVQGKSSLARFIILTLYSELTEEDKNGIKRLFGNDVEKACDKACDAFCKTHCPNLMSFSSTTPSDCGGRIHDDCDDLHKFISLMKGE